MNSTINFRRNRRNQSKLKPNFIRRTKGPQEAAHVGLALISETEDNAETKIEYQMRKYA